MGHLSVADIREALEVTATDLGNEGKDIYYGHGLVNAQAALLYLGFTLSPSISSAPTATHSNAPSSFPSISRPPSQAPSASPSSSPSISAAPSVAPKYCSYGFYGGNGR